MAVLSREDQGNARHQPAPTSQSKVGRHPLRATITPADPKIFRYAFAEDIGIPPERAGWKELLARGGVNIGTALFNVTLANRSQEPITVRDIHAEVVRSEPAPTAATAYVFTQGDAGLGEFAAHFTSTAIGARAELYKVEGTPAARPRTKPFFESNYISLRPGEIYEASIVVVMPSTPTMVSYKFQLSGSTPQRSLTIRHPDIARISGLLYDDRVTDPQYDHYYVKGYLDFAAHECPSFKGKVRQWFAETRRSITTSCP